MVCFLFTAKHMHPEKKILFLTKFSCQIDQAWSNIELTT